MLRHLPVDVCWMHSPPLSPFAAVMLPPPPSTRPAISPATWPTPCRTAHSGPSKPPTQALTLLLPPGDLLLSKIGYTLCHTIWLSRQPPWTRQCFCRSSRQSLRTSPPTLPYPKPPICLSTLKPHARGLHLPSRTATLESTITPLLTCLDWILTRNTRKKLNQTTTEVTVKCPSSTSTLCYYCSKPSLELATIPSMYHQQLCANFLTI